MTTEEFRILHKEGIWKYDVYEIIKHSFGEENVEVDFGEESLTFDPNTNKPSSVAYKASMVIIHYPNIRVTNENDEYVDLENLFIRFIVGQDGHLNEVEGYWFQIMRTTYTMEQAFSGYTHSHISSNTGLGNWGNPCLGYGPIKNTAVNLSRICNMERWMLFCVELDIYAHTESLRGGPYIRLDSIGQYSGNTIGEGVFSNDLYYNPIDRLHSSIYAPSKTYYRNKEICTITTIVCYMLKQDSLKFCYKNGKYDVANTAVDFIMLVSNTLIGILKQYGYKTKSSLLTDYSDFKECVFKGTHFLEVRQLKNFERASIEENNSVIKFKGIDYPLIVQESKEKQPLNTYAVLNATKIQEVYHALIYYVNNYYGNKTRIKGQTITI